MLQWGRYPMFISGALQTGQEGLVNQTEDPGQVGSGTFCFGKKQIIYSQGAYIVYSVTVWEME